ncbi:MAG: hypothetical protein ABJC74_02765, partial [Gemmatimonadota bacterium]
MLKREILINGTPRETRVAILEDDRLAELMIDRPDHRRSVGDIYLGRVEAVLPGIQAAFIDIGLEKSAFLHASDLLEPDEDDDEDEEEVDHPDDPAAAEAAAAAPETESEEPRPAGGRNDRGGRTGGRNGRGGRNGVAAPEPESRQREVSSRGAIPNIQDLIKKGET